MADAVIFDFGMHKGEDTEFYLAIGAKVIAFEANSELVQQNSAKFADAIEEGRLVIHYGAIVPPEHEGEVVTFYSTPSKSVWGTADPEWVVRNSTLGHEVKEVEVPAVRLDQVLALYPPALYMKIDIEGADQIVVDAVRRQAARPEFLSIESEKHSFDALVGEIETLKSMGYSRFAAVQQATIPGRVLSGVTLDEAPFRYTFRKHSSGPFGRFLDQSLFKSADEVIDDYRLIFERYRRFGDQSFFMTHGLTRLPTRALNKLSVKLLGAPFCGWYDTHAAR